MRKSEFSSHPLLSFRTPTWNLFFYLVITWFSKGRTACPEFIEGHAPITAYKRALLEAPLKNNYVILRQFDIIRKILCPMCIDIFKNYPLSIKRLLDKARRIIGNSDSSRRLLSACFPPPRNRIFNSSSPHSVSFILGVFVNYRGRRKDDEKSQ